MDDIFGKILQKRFLLFTYHSQTNKHFVILARKSKVDDYSKFSNEEFHASNGKIPGKGSNHLKVPNYGDAERVMSQSSFKDPKSIENVTDWSKIIKKYYALIRFVSHSKVYLLTSLFREN